MNYYQRGYREKDMVDDVVRPEQPRLLLRSFEMLLREEVQTKEQIVAALPFGRREIEMLAGLPQDFLRFDEVEPPLSIRLEHRPGAVVKFTRTK